MQCDFALRLGIRKILCGQSGCVIEDRAMNEATTQDNGWVDFGPLSTGERFSVALLLLGSTAVSTGVVWILLRGFLLGWV